MSEVKRRKRYRSPPPIPIPVLPNPVRVEPKVSRSKPKSEPAPPKNPDETSRSEIELNSMENSRNFDESYLSNRTVLPSFGRFPFDVSFSRSNMESQVEDNVHKLRLRLIDSELNHQRETSNEYIKRTQKQIALASPTLEDPPMQNFRAPSALVQTEFVPKILSRQSTLTPLANNETLFRDRSTALDDEFRLNAELERDLEIRRIQDSLNNVPASRQTLRISNFPYDSRLHLYSGIGNRQYSSSNMDDLIDSMARRHLAQRRLDVAIDQQRRTSGHSLPYIHPVSLPRSPLVDDDYPYSRRTPRTFGRTNSNAAFTQLLRSRIDHYRRMEAENENLNFDETFRGNPYQKLPPISPGYETRHQLQNNYAPNSVRRFPPETGRSEHRIELPSDIFLSSQREILQSSHRRPFSKARTERSDLEVDMNTLLQQTSRDETTERDGDQAFFTETTNVDRRDVRNLLKRTSMVVVFLFHLRRRAKETRSRRIDRSPSAAIHKIRLQEIIVALHRVYLEPDGPIYNALTNPINHPLSLADALNVSSKNYSQAIDLIGDSLKTIIANIVDFMPHDGVVGTGENSAVSILLQNGNPFPDNYFWQCERELLVFDGPKVIRIDKQQAILLLIGIFIFRALITTILIKPIKYRLILGRLTSTQAANLKMLASTILYIARRVPNINGKPVPMPAEWQLSLYSDETIRPICEHAEIQPVMKNCENNLRQWSEEYIRRITNERGKQRRA